MSNEEIVIRIGNGYSVTDNMQLLYESNLPFIKRFYKFDIKRNRNSKNIVVIEIWNKFY